MTGKMKLAGVVVAMLLFFAAVSGTGYALADDSLPGEALYGLKGAVERVRVNLTRSPEARAELAIGLAEQRLEEIGQMLKEGQPVDAGTANEAKHQVMSARHAAGAVSGPYQETFRNRFEQMLGAQLGVLARVKTRAGEDNGDVDNLLALMEQYQHQYQYQYQHQNQTQAGEGADTPVDPQGPPDEIPAGAQSGDPAQAGYGPYLYYYGKDAPGQYGPGAQDSPPQAPVETKNQGEAKPAYGPGPQPAGPVGGSDSSQPDTGSGQQNRTSEQNNGSKGGNGGGGGH